MTGPDHNVASFVNNAGLFLGWVAPQQPDKGSIVVPLEENVQHGIGKVFPTLAGVTARFALSYGQHIVEEKDSLLRPPSQAPVPGGRRLIVTKVTKVTNVIGEFPQHVAQ